MKKLISLAVAIVMLFTLCACGGTSTSTPVSSANANSGSSTNANESSSGASTADDTVYTLKWATTETEATIRYQYLEKPIMDLITEKTNGRITFNVFFSSSLAGSGAIIKGCQDRICDAGCDNINSYPGVFLYAELMATPGISLGNSYEEKYNSMKEYYEAYAYQEAYNNGVYPLFCAPALDVVLMSTFPVESTDSYKGKTVCCNGSYSDMFENYGAAITWVVPPEQYEALRLNVIDASVNGAGPLSAFNLYEVLDYAYYIPFATVTSAYYLSKSVYDSLPADLQAILDEIQFSDELLEINMTYVDAMMGDVMTACFEGNADFTFNDLPEDVAAAMQASCADYIAGKQSELAAAGLDAEGAMALLNSFSE